MHEYFCTWNYLGEYPRKFFHDAIDCAFNFTPKYAKLSSQIQNCKQNSSSRYLIFKLLFIYYYLFIHHLFIIIDLFSFIYHYIFIFIIILLLCYLVWYARHNHQQVLGLVIFGSSLWSCLNKYSSGDVSRGVRLPLKKKKKKLQTTNLDGLDNRPQVFTACGHPRFSIAQKI